MQNAGIAGGLVAIGMGLATIGLSNFSRNAEAVPASVVQAGPEDPTIVWYGTESTITRTGSSTTSASDTSALLVFRAWSDGTIEYRALRAITGTEIYFNCEGVTGDPFLCKSEWQVFSSPNEGLNAAADINFDEVVDGGDLGQLLASWGNAPRNPMPPSDCPLGLIQ